MLIYHQFCTVYHGIKPRYLTPSVYLAGTLGYNETGNTKRNLRTYPCQKCFLIKFWWLHCWHGDTLVLFMHSLCLLSLTISHSPFNTFSKQIKTINCQCIATCISVGNFTVVFNQAQACHRWMTAIRAVVGLLCIGTACLLWSRWTDKAYNAFEVHW